MYDKTGTDYQQHRAVTVEITIHIATPNEHLVWQAFCNAPRNATPAWMRENINRAHMLISPAATRSKIRWVPYICTKAHIRCDSTAGHVSDGVRHPNLATKSDRFGKLFSKTPPPPTCQHCQARRFSDVDRRFCATRTGLGRRGFFATVPVLVS
jgi:hypothetical protein